MPALPADSKQKAISLGLAFGIHALIVFAFFFSWQIVQGSKTQTTGISIILEKGISDSPKAMTPPQQTSQPAVKPEPQPELASINAANSDKAVAKPHPKKITPKKLPPQLPNVAPSPSMETSTASAVSSATTASSQNAPSSDGAASASGDTVTGVRAIYRPEPSYPPLAKEQHQQGKVLLHVAVSDSGKPIAVTVKKESGFLLLDEAAVAAVKQWRFSPATKVGIPIATEVEIPIIFHLE